DYDPYWGLFRGDQIKVKVSGETAELLGLNGFEVPLSVIFSYYIDEYNTYQTSAPNSLTEEENLYLKENFNKGDFQFILESEWLPNGEKS
ncbi:hypothetical protein, partial [Pseudomonas sp. 2995-1]|uniref:hypothetical protein n=1 Tax=Pseudomonas sp. 2995-1 TaxID=1712679 RepID=UPI0013044831